MKNFLKSVIFCLIFVVLLGISIYFLIPQKNIRKYNFINILDYEILEEDDNQIDVLFVGDSLVYSSVSPMEIWNEYGFTSFDCSTPAQLTETAYEYIKIAVERQHPKVIFLEANILFRDPAKRTDERKMKDLGDRYSLLTKYHDNWKDYISYGEKINSTKGYYYISRTNKAIKNNYMEDKHKIETIPTVNMEYFDKIIDICNNNNITLLLFGVPSMKSWTYAKDVKANEIASSYNLKFIDLNLNNMIDIDWEDETKDEGSHLNYKGAKKVSKYLGQYLYDNNLVENHKEDEKYNKWHEAYKKYQRLIDFN